MTCGNTPNVATLPSLLLPLFHELLYLKATWKCLGRDNTQTEILSHSWSSNSDNSNDINECKLKHVYILCDMQGALVVRISARCICGVLVSVKIRDPIFNLTDIPTIFKAQVVLLELHRTKNRPLLFRTSCHDEVCNFRRGRSRGPVSGFC